MADEDRLAVVSNMGARLVGQERLADSRNIARAVQMQEEHHGWKFRAVMSLEIGGNNSLLWDQHAEPADVGALRRDGWPGNAGRLAS